MKVPLLLVCLLTLACAVLAADAPRIAIIADPASADASQLLTASLSSEPVLLLERDEIDRVLSEQKLSAAGLTASNLPTVGTMLRADGLIFLRNEQLSGKAVLTTRLVAVGPGVIVGAWQNTSPLENASSWSRETAKALANFWPKLAVSREAAIPISVVNVRAVRSSADAERMERELTLLLEQRLAHEPSFFVLERRQLNSLLPEKEDESSAFWSGRYMINGTIEQSFNDADQLTIRLRLQRPRTIEATTIVHTCRSGELLAGVESIVSEIVRNFDREPTTSKWDTSREAGEFWGDAQWAFRNELFTRSSTAAEAAWALGMRSDETLALRIRAELLAARPELVLPYRYPAKDQYLQSYLTQRNSFWRASLPYTRGYRTPDVLARIFKEMPEGERTERLARTRRALELYRDHVGELLAAPEKTPLAMQVLTIGGAMLDWFSSNRPEWDDEMRRVGSDLREIDQLTTERVVGFNRLPGHKPPPLFWQSKAALTPLWAKNAAETLGTYRAALAQPFGAERRGEILTTILHSHDLFPFLTVAGDQSEAAEVFDGFVTELTESHSPADRWLGLALRYELTGETAKNAIATKLRDDIWTERARFARGEFPYEYFTLLRAPGERVEEGVDRSGAASLSAFTGFRSQFLLYLLRESTPIDRDCFWELFTPESYNEAEAREILEAITHHEDRVRKAIGRHWMLGVIRERSEDLLLRFPQLRQTKEADALQITRYWTPYLLPEFQDGKFSAADFAFKEAIYRENRLWVFGTFREREKDTRSPRAQYVFGIDLKTFETEVIPFEEPPPLANPRNYHWGGADLEVTADAIYVSKDWQLSRYDRFAKTWRHFTDLPGVWLQPRMIHGRLYVRLNNSPTGISDQRFGEMVELDPRTGVSKLIVSDRREPAISPMDRWSLAWLTAREGAGGKVLFRGIFSGGRSKREYVAYDPASEKWEPLNSDDWAKGGPGGSAAHMAMASDDSAWVVEGRAAGSDTLFLRHGHTRIPFRCKLDAKLRTALLKNGPSPTVEVVEQNVLTGLASPPLGFATPDGVAISTVFYMPGFWFTPSAELEQAQEAFGISKAR